MNAEGMGANEAKSRDTSTVLNIIGNWDPFILGDETLAEDWQFKVFHAKIFLCLESIAVHERSTLRDARSLPI